MGRRAAVFGACHLLRRARPPPRPVRRRCRLPVPGRSANPHPQLSACRVQRPPRYCRRRASALLQSDGGRQPGDAIHLWRAGWQQQATGIRSDRFKVAALGLGVDGPERQRRFAGSGDPSERNHRVTRRYHVDTAMIVHARPINTHAGVDVVRGFQDISVIVLDEYPCRGQASMPSPVPSWLLRCAGI